MKIGIWARVGATLLSLAAAVAQSQPAASPEANDASRLDAAAIAAAKKTLADASLPSSDDPLVLARSLLELALADVKQKNFARAESSCLTALTLQEHAPGSNERAMVQTLFRLGSLHADRNHYALAEQYYRRSLDTAARAFPDRDTPTFGGLLHTLGTVYDNEGDVAMAEQSYSRAAAAFGEKEPRGLAIALHSLGDLYFKTARFARAAPVYERQLALADRMAEPERSQIVNVADRNNIANRLADTYRKLGRYDEAFPLYQRALASVEQRLGPTNQPKLVAYLEGLAKLYREMGRLPEAEALEREAATRRAASGGK